VKYSEFCRTKILNDCCGLANTQPAAAISRCRAGANFLISAASDQPTLDPQDLSRASLARRTVTLPLSIVSRCGAYPEIIAAVKLAARKEPVDTSIGL
jgi:hypothetical protein